MSKARRKLKIGQSISKGEKRADPLSERQRETRQFVIWTMVVPLVLMVIIVMLYLFKVWG